MVDIASLELDLGLAKSLMRTGLASLSQVIQLPNEVRNANSNQASKNSKEVSRGEVRARERTPQSQRNTSVISPNHSWQK